MVEVATAVVRNYNGRHGDLWGKMDVWKNSEINTLKQTIMNLKTMGFEGNGGTVARKAGKGKKGGDKLVGIPFMKDRAQVRVSMLQTNGK